MRPAQLDGAKTAPPAPHDAEAGLASLSAPDLLAIIRTLPDVVFRCEKRADGRIYWTLNEGRLAEEFHLTTQEVQGRSMDDLFPGDANRPLRDHFEAAFRGEAHEFVNALAGRFFKHFPQPICDETGRVVAVVGFITEVTATEGARRQIESLNAELVDRLMEMRGSNEALEAFGYTVTHDLRGPLSSILLACEVAMLEARDEKMQKIVRRIRSAAERMGRLIEDLLRLSRAGRAEINRAEVDLAAMAHEVVADLQVAEPDRPIVLEIEGGLATAGDAGLLRQVLANLLTNAWKYTRTTPLARIEVGADRVGDERRFFVRDNGIGFDPHEAGNLFEPFHRLDNAGEYEGTGIGLATVRKIVQRHGGRVWAEGRPGAGACFWFTLGDPQ